MGRSSIQQGLHCWYPDINPVWAASEGPQLPCMVNGGCTDETLYTLSGFPKPWLILSFHIVPVPSCFPGTGQAGMVQSGGSGLW